MYSDVIIIGGGASGLLCAIKAKEEYNKVLILEKQGKLGRKLLSTGNGRCNITNMNISSKNYHGSFSKYIDSILQNYPPEKLIDFLKNLCLYTKVDSEGRVYPLSNHASSVIDVLKLKIQQLNIDVKYDVDIKDIKCRDGFTVITNDGNYKCKKLVFATGSKASPKLGSDKSGLDLLEKLGHKVTSLSPALCPIPVKNKINTLKGVRATGKVSLYSNNKCIKTEIGEIQFTEDALSGICVFNLSSLLTENNVIQLSLLPKMNDKKLLSMLYDRKNKLSSHSVENFFDGLFVKQLGHFILKESNIKLNRKINSLTDKELKNFINEINHKNFTVIKKLSFEKAQVVSGGVLGSEINPETMESKIHKNLFICGEAIDINGDCGGYNLQFAFSSGIIAGENL